MLLSAVGPVNNATSAETQIIQREAAGSIRHMTQGRRDAGAADAGQVTCRVRGKTDGGGFVRAPVRGSWRWTQPHQFNAFQPSSGARHLAAAEAGVDWSRLDEQRETCSRTVPVVYRNCPCALFAGNQDW